MILHSPVLDQRDINGTPCATRSEIERPWRPQQGDAVGCVVCVQRGLLEEGLHILRKLKLLIIFRQRLLTLNWDKRVHKLARTIRHEHYFKIKGDSKF